MLERLCPGASVGMEVILERSTLLFCTSKLKEEWWAHLGQTVWGTGKREGAYFYVYFFLSPVQNVCMRNELTFKFLQIEIKRKCDSPTK